MYVGPSHPGVDGLGAFPVRMSSSVMRGWSSRTELISRLRLSVDLTSEPPGVKERPERTGVYASELQGKRSGILMAPGRAFLKRAE